MDGRTLLVAASMCLAALAGALPAAARSAPASERPSVGLYFTRGETIGVVRRPATGPAGTLRLLLAGPTPADRAHGLGTEIPSGTRLRGLSVAGGIARVDVSRRFESSGGSLSMLLRVAEVVHTLTQFSAIRRVAFALDGRRVESIGGEGIIVDPPVSRRDFEDQAPPILVERPGIGDTVTAPVRVSGTANVFEARFELELRDARGGLLSRASVLATAGTGTRGRFAATLRFGRKPRSSRLTLVAFQRSPKDGQPIHVVRTPLVLER